MERKCTCFCVHLIKQVLESFALQTTEDESSSTDRSVVEASSHWSWRETSSHHHHHHPREEDQEMWSHWDGHLRQKHDFRCISVYIERNNSNDSRQHKPGRTVIHVHYISFDLVLIIIVIYTSLILDFFEEMYLNK